MTGFASTVRVKVSVAVAPSLSVTVTVSVCSPTEKSVFGKVSIVAPSFQTVVAIVPSLSLDVGAGE